MRSLTESSWKLPAVAGVLFFLGYFSPLLVPNLVALVPVLLWLDANPDAGARRRYRVGFLLGTFIYVGALHWEYAMLRFSWLAAFLYVGMIAYFAVFVSSAFALLGWLRRRTELPWVVLLPVGWLPFEWLRTLGDFRLTPDHVGHAMARFPFLVQFADLAGPYGVGAVVLATNALIYGVWRGPRPLRRRSAAALVTLVVVVLGYDAWAWHRWGEPAPTVRIGVVQPNVPLDVKHGEDTAPEQWRTLDRLTRAAVERGATLVVWPETAWPYPVYHWLDRPETYAIPPVQDLARRLGVSLLVGSEYARVRSKDEFEFYNAAFAIHPDGRLDPVWTAKIYLVPFVEKLPYPALLGGLLADRGGEWRWVSGGFEPGPRATVLPFDGLEVGTVVCFEELFPDLMVAERNAGADVIALLTNDAWFGRSLFQRYLADAARMRAIESRIAFVRAANTGYSGFVDPRGRYLARSELFEEAVLVADVPRVSVRTLYDRIGDVVAWLAIAGLVGSIGLAALRAAVAG